jgi:hypothetical protein
MYYEEKWIDGILHSRGTPNGKWEPVSAFMLGMKIRELENKLAESEREVSALMQRVEE